MKKTSGPGLNDGGGQAGTRSGKQGGNMNKQDRQEHLQLCCMGGIIDLE